MKTFVCERPEGSQANPPTSHKQNSHIVTLGYGKHDLGGRVGRYSLGKGRFEGKLKSLCFVAAVIGSTWPLRSASSPAIRQCVCKYLTGCNRLACTTAGQKTLPREVAFRLLFVCVV